MQEGLPKSGFHRINRRYFIGGSDARIIIGGDEPALVRLCREKRGEAEPEDLSGNLVVQLGIAIEDLKPRLYERITHRMAAGWYIVALCYATAVISKGMVALEYSSDPASVQQQQAPATQLDGACG